MGTTRAIPRSSSRRAFSSAACHSGAVSVSRSGPACRSRPAASIRPITIGSSRRDCLSDEIHGECHGCNCGQLRSPPRSWSLGSAHKVVGGDSQTPRLRARSANRTYRDTHVTTRWSRVIVPPGSNELRPLFGVKHRRPASGVAASPHRGYAELMKCGVLMLAVILASLQAVASADIFAWTDSAGVTHYTNLTGEVPSQQTV